MGAIHVTIRSPAAPSRSWNSLFLVGAAPPAR